MNDAAPPTTKKEEVRIYPVLDAQGVPRYIKARSIYDAVVHVFRPHIGKPMTGVEVAQLYEDGGRVEIALTAKQEPQA